MSRIARVVIPGLPHHITQRGNRREEVFTDDADRHAYLNGVRHAFRAYSVKVWAYCLMTNHVHFVAVPEQCDSLALAFRDAHAAYATSFNRKNRTCGHLWQGRFFSTPLDEQHVWYAVRYVERNPVRAGMVRRAEEYIWSSARAHCGIGDDSLLSRDFPFTGTKADWIEWLGVDPPEQTELLRERTRTGRPCGTDEFTRSLEQQLDRSLRPSPRGRKKRVQDSETTSLFEK